MNNKLYRHGDLSFHPTEEKGLEEIKHKGSFILAEGETTGHKHVIVVPNIDDMVVEKTKDGGYILTLKTDAKISHEEHNTIVLPKGNYKMIHEREKDWFSLAVRQVVD